MMGYVMLNGFKALEAIGWFSPDSLIYGTNVGVTESIFGCFHHLR